MTLKAPLALALAGLVACGGFSAEAQAVKYGCFKVSVPSLNIRARPYSNADVIGVAHKGDILEKRKLFCTPRGFWCAIRKGSLEGYADKANLSKIACP